MARSGRTVGLLALVSAALASVVPGVFEPSLALAPQAAVGTLSGSVRIGGEAGGEVSVRLAVPASVGMAFKRTRIPVGCERLVSPLTKSAAASQIARCVT